MVSWSWGPVGCGEIDLGWGSGEPLREGRAEAWSKQAFVKVHPSGVLYLRSWRGWRPRSGGGWPCTAVLLALSVLGGCGSCDRPHPCGIKRRRFVSEPPPAVRGSRGRDLGKVSRLGPAPVDPQRFRQRSGNTHQVITDRRRGRVRACGQATVRDRRRRHHDDARAARRVGLAPARTKGQRPSGRAHYAP